MITTKEEGEIIHKQISDLYKIPENEIEPDKVYIVKHPRTGLTTFWIWGSELLKAYTPEFKKMMKEYKEQESNIWYGKIILK